MATTDAQKKAARKYIVEKTDEMKIHVKKGNKQIFKDHAKDMGESLNGFLKRAIYETLEKDLNSNHKEKQC